MSYLWFYSLMLLFFFVLERIIPKRKQDVLRPQITNDVLYAIVNGHYSGTLIYILSTELLLWLHSAFGLSFTFFDQQLLQASPVFLQVIVALVVKDFFSWLVHNTLHRVGWLWQFHKLHHSAEEMDFWVVMRFHWMEIVVYRTALFIPLLLLGIPADVFIYVIFIEVFWGFFNHANINVSIGWLKYIFNSPAMHMYHHEEREQDIHKNFGITLSLWDWLFGTAYWPDRPCGKLGFDDLQTYPSSVIKQYFFGFFKR